MNIRMIQIALAMGSLTLMQAQTNRRETAAEPINQVQEQSFSALVLVQDEHGPRLAEPGETFTDGQRFKLNIKTADAGYIYLLLLSAQGEAKLLFPYKTVDSGNTIPRNRYLTLPSRGWYRFDEEPGIERFYIVTSPVSIRELDTAAENGGDLPMTTLRNYARSASTGRAIAKPVNGNDGDLDELGESKGVITDGDRPVIARKIQLVHDPQ